MSVEFKNAHENIPQSILLTYSAYSYFYSELHINDGTVSNTGFGFEYIPKEIGNGTGSATVYWAAFW